MLLLEGQSARGEMTDTRREKAGDASEMPIKHLLFVGNMQIR